VDKKLLDELAGTVGNEFILHGPTSIMRFLND
jgi:hypothetical protein